MKIRDSHQLSGDLYHCPDCGRSFRYSDEAAACKKSNPELLAKRLAVVRLSIPGFVNYHNRLARIIEIGEKPIPDPRFQKSKDSVMTFGFTVQMIPDGEVPDFPFFSDQVIPISDQEVAAAVKRDAERRKKRGRMIGSSKGGPATKKVSEEISPKALSNFEKGLAEGLDAHDGETGEADLREIDSLDSDDFNDEDVIEIEV